MHRKHDLSGLLLLGLIVFATAPAPASAIPARIWASLSPAVSVGDASSEQADRLAFAVDRFHNAGLPLPDLEVRFSYDQATRNGGMGLFQTEHIPWRITICSQADFVYAHELTHAWELANLTDETRQRFMELRGHLSWADPSVPWSERGVEGVAFIIEQGLLDQPLPAIVSDELASRLAAFELLTGKPSPRLDTG